MLLSVENLRVSYGNIRALHGIDFQIDDGEIVCIIGANGAGKSTTLRAISRLVPVEEGTTMTFMGNDLLKYPADKVVSEFGISHVPEGRRLFGNLTIMENLRLATFSRKDNEKIQEDLKRVFSIFPRLEERKNQKSGTLSGGEQQMLAMGRALVSGPKIILLDEPSEGLAPVIVQQISEVIRQLAEQGIAVLLVEQNFNMALKLASRIFVMSRGLIVHESSPEELAHNQEVKARFLGM